MNGDRPFIRPCPVCGCGSGRDLGRLTFTTFDDSPLKGDFRVVTCPACGLGFYDAALNGAEVEEYYRRNSYYAAAATPGGGGSSLCDQAHYREIISRLRAFLPAQFDGPVFDVGCARGGLLKELAAAGFSRLYGVDPLPDSVRRVRGLGLAAEAATGDSLPFLEIAPELIIFSHVLEHALHPGRMLAEARRRLAPGGRLYVEVPDAAAYPRDIPFQELYLEHLNHFTAPSLGRLLHRNGFRPLALAGAIFNLDRGRKLPVLWALAEASDDGGTGPAEEPAGDGALAAYLAWSRGHPLSGFLEKLAGAGRPCWVWGLSQLTMLLLGSSPLGRADLAGFIDADPGKAARTIGGRQIEGPEALRGRPPREGLFLASWAYEAEMRRRAAEINFQGPICSLAEAMAGGEPSDSWSSL